jgi:imidazolonepropionase
MWDTLIRRAHLLTFDTGSPYGSIRRGALAVQGGRIAWVGPDDELPANSAREEIDAGGALVTPGLIDCHTHLVHAGQRAREFERRLAGSTYEEIARAGGGIRATVAATRAADEEALLAASLPRLRALAAEGVTTVEVKSGYGLNLETELRMLRVARRMGHLAGVMVRTSFLGAHAVPEEFAGRADAYLDFLIAEVLLAAVREGLIDAVDAYCEPIAFSPAQVTRLFGAARKLGLPVKLHADQRSDQGGAALVASFGGLSADHLEYASPEGISALARSGTAAVLLPGAFLFLQETHLPPIGGLRRAGVPLAVATDCNPGTSPLCSILGAVALACTLFRLTPAEALAGVTRNAAAALGLADRGRLEAGLRADLALWAVEEPAELAFRLGPNPLLRRFVAGRSDHAPSD